MIVQYFIIGTFWLSYLAITFASVITIADFVQKVKQSWGRKRVKSSSEIEDSSVKLHISEGLIEVNRLPNEQEKA